MKSKNLLMVMAASVVLAGLAGCGGKGSNNTTTPTAVVPLTGGVTTALRTTSVAVPASPAGTTGTATETTAVVGGVSKTVSIPASTDAFPAGAPIAIFPDNVPIISGTIASRAAGDVRITRYGGGGISDITTTFSNIVSSTNGSIVLTKPIGLLPGTYIGVVEGPVTIGSGSKTLTVANFGFRFSVTDAGVCSFPTSVTGILPTNGGHTGNGAINVGITSPAGEGGAATLRIAAGDTVDVMQSGFLNAFGSFTFKSTKGGFSVPSTGVEYVDISVYPPTN